MKDQKELKELFIHKCNLYEFFIEGVECNIIQSGDLFNSYINGKWLEDKSSSLEEAVDCTLKHIGIKKEVRESLIIKLKNESRTN